jgi:hypothetical protein
MLDQRELGPLRLWSTIGSGRETRPTEPGSQFLSRELLNLLIEHAKPSTCVILADARKRLEVRKSFERANVSRG